MNTNYAIDTSMLDPALHPTPLVIPQPYTLLSGHEVGQWVADRACEGRYDAKTSVSIGLLRGERIIAGAIFNNWNHASVQLHMAIERMNRQFLIALAHYAFIQLAANVVVAPVSSANDKSQHALEHAGFKLEACITAGHPDGDLLLYVLPFHACRFLNASYFSRRIGDAHGW